MMGYKIEFAVKEDDSSIRRLLSSNPMPGPISISYERNPNFFDSLRLQGEENQVVVARDSNKGVLAVGTRSMQEVYLNKSQHMVGYLSNLRVDRNHLREGILSSGMRFFKELDKDQKIDFYYMTIIDSNSLAKKIFFSNKEGYPLCYDLGRINTYIIPLGRAIKSEPGRARKADKDTVKKVIRFMNDLGKEKNFFPQLDQEVINKGLGIQPENFYYCTKDNVILGAACVWDQSRFKQNIIRGYASYMAFVKPIYNLYCAITKSRKLPDLDTELKVLYLSYIAIREDSPKSLKCLIDTILTDYAGSEYAYIAIGIHERDPLNKAATRYRHILYTSTAYLVSWTDQKELYDSLKESRLYFEIARL